MTYGAESTVAQSRVSHGCVLCQPLQDPASVGKTDFGARLWYFVCMCAIARCASACVRACA